MANHGSWKQVRIYWRLPLLQQARDLGVGNFRIPGTALSGTHPVVGEQAGFQDTLWGFGMREAITSGVLAAPCMACWVTAVIAGVCVARKITWMHASSCTVATGPHSPGVCWRPWRPCISGVSGGMRAAITSIAAVSGAGMAGSCIHSVCAGYFMIMPAVSTWR